MVVALHCHLWYVGMVLGSTAASRLLMTAVIHLAGTGLTLVVNVCTRLRSMVTTLVQCIYNARWCSISCNERYAFGSNVAMAATGLWQVAYTTYVLLSKAKRWPTILKQIMLLRFLAFQGGRGFP